tara:strand:+ start:874 stop:1809 length:936 start_codon:yes stop_codon:yes gene_type:complete
MPGEGGGSQTVTNKTELPEWVQAAGQKNLAAAYDVSANMLGPYEGQRVASMTPGTESIIGNITQNAAMSQPAFAYAQELAKQAGSYQPQQVQAGQVASTDLSSYMNPYTQAVIGSSLSALERQRLGNLNTAYDAAVKAKAFGGSRQAIQEGIVSSTAQEQAGSLVAKLMAENFTQAQKAAQYDIDTRLQAEKLNQSAGLTAADLGIKGAATIGTLASTGQEAYQMGQTGALAAQQLLQAQQQAELDAAQQSYREAQQFPIQQLQIPLQALGATPYGQTNTQTGPGPTSNPLMTGLGAAGSAVSIMAGLASL